MRLEPDQFGDFFRALNDDRSPFAWQERLLHHVLSEQRWPDRVAAPTGAGKTAVIDVHIFAVALMAGGAGIRIPRRLSLVVDRRALVDSQYDRAREISQRLHDAERAGDGLLADVARLLRGLRSDRDAETPPVTVSTMRGGAVPSTRWRDDPTACAVICATPDMWGSRLLLRGYGTSRHARPREAGLLAYDSVIVVDEAHLARQLVETARRIPALEAMAVSPIDVPVLQVVETTATPADEPGAGDRPNRPISVIAVDAEDLADPSGADALLARRLQAPKPVRMVEGDWPATTAGGRKSLAASMADAAEGLRERLGPTVACVANTVLMALAVAAELEKRGRVVEVLVGRMRPFDIARLRDRRPGLLSTEGDGNVDFVVATQTIEVGIDADFTAMVTELAPGSSLAQRAGRVNRLGRWAATEVQVFTPGDDSTLAADALPYRAVDLTEALAWLRRREIDSTGMAPWALVADPPPEQGLRRTLLHRPEPWDAWSWARTSDDLALDADLDLWLADDLEADTDVALVVRQGLPPDPVDAVALIRATPPRSKEAFPVSLRVATKVAESGGGGPLYRVRGDDVELLDPGTALRPGEVVVVGNDMACFERGVVVEVGTGTSTDVLEEPQGNRDRLVLRVGAGMPLDTAIGSEAGAALLADLVEAHDAHPRDGRDRRAALGDVLDRFLRGEARHSPEPAIARIRAARDLLRGRIADTEVSLGQRPSGSHPTWLVIADARRSLADEELRQTWTSGEGQVTLESHAAGVADRAAEVAHRVGLDDAMTEHLRMSGRHHDDGKRDPRFQRMLTGDPRPEVEPAAELLAKSGMRSRAEARAALAGSGLPTGWRHEQLSAGCAWQAMEGRAAETRALVTRLVGTSHGHGRSGFPHIARDLVGDDATMRASCVELFDGGGWDELVERTHRLVGVWGCAYLEALLRAADGQVSREGR